MADALKAAKALDADKLERAISKGGVTAANAVNKKGETPLIVACEAASGGDTDEEDNLKLCIDVLIEGGADVTRVDTSGRSAVAIAASNALESHATILLSAAATARNGGKSGACRWLDTLSDGMAAFHWCINKKLRRLTRDIIAFQAAPAPIVDDNDDADDQPPKKSIPKKGGKGKKSKDNDDNDEAAAATPTTTAGVEEKKVTVMVASPRPNLNVRSHKGYTALHMAIDDADWELINILIEHGVPNGLDLSIGDNTGDTAYHHAVRLATTTTSCMTAAYDAADIWPRVLKALAAGGAPVNAVNSNGMTPLHLAYSLTALLQAALADRSQWSLIKLLIELGSDVNIRDNNGDTPSQLVDSVARLHGDRQAASEEKLRQEREAKEVARDKKRAERDAHEREKEAALENKISDELKQWLIDNDVRDASLYVAKRDIFTLSQLKALTRNDLTSIDTAAGVGGRLVDAIVKAEQAEFRSLLDADVLKFLAENGLETTLGPLLVGRKLTFAQLPHLTSGRIANWFPGHHLTNERSTLEAALEKLRSSQRAHKIADMKEDDAKKSAERLRNRNNTTATTDDTESKSSTSTRQRKNKKKDTDDGDDDNEGDDEDIDDDNKPSNTNTDDNGVITKPTAGGQGTMIAVLLLLLVIIAWLLLSS